MNTYHFKADVTSTVVFGLEAPSGTVALEMWGKAMRDNKFSDWIYGKALDEGGLKVSFECIGREGAASPFDEGNIDITDEVSEALDNRRQSQLVGVANGLEQM